MANTISYVSKANITAIVEQMRTYIDSDKTLAIKAVKAIDNGIAFYNVATPADDTVPTFKIDFPAEYFLDQTKTTFVDNFAFSAETYVGATDPVLDGKPVFVLAVKGDDDTVTYSFVNLEKLMPNYEGEATNTADTTIADNKVKVDVKVSAEEGNILSAKEDGLYASVTEVDISTKADKLANPDEGDAVIKTGQILVDDGNGNLAASGKTIDEVKSDVLDELVEMTDEEINALFA